MDFFGTEIECTLPLMFDDLMIAEINCQVNVSDNGSGGFEVDSIDVDDLAGSSDNQLSKKSKYELADLWKKLSSEALRSEFVKDKYGIKKREHDYWEAA